MTAINGYPLENFLPNELPNEYLENSWRDLSPTYSRRWSSYLLDLGGDKPLQTDIYSFYGYLYEDVVLNALRNVLDVHVSGSEEIVEFYQEYICPWLVTDYPYFGSRFFQKFSTPDGLSALNGTGIENLSYPKVSFEISLKRRESELPYFLKKIDGFLETVLFTPAMYRNCKTLCFITPTNVHEGLVSEVISYGNRKGIFVRFISAFHSKKFATKVDELKRSATSIL